MLYEQTTAGKKKGPGKGKGGINSFAGKQRKTNAAGQWKQECEPAIELDTLVSDFQG